MHVIYIPLVVLAFWLVGLNLTVFIASLLIKRINISIYDFYMMNIVGLFWLPILIYLIYLVVKNRKEMGIG